MMNILRLAIISLVLSSIPNFTMAQTKSEADRPQKNDVDFQSDTLTYTIYGMDCPGCEGGLEKQVNKIPSIKYSKANWVNQELLIVLKPDSILNQEELERRVKKANFTLITEQENKEE